MSRRSRLPALLVSAVLAGAWGCASQAPAPMTLERSIPLAGSGRIDHLAVDEDHHRVFVAELGAGAVEAVDLTSGRSLGRVTGLNEPQGLGYLHGSGQLAVASGGDGTLRFYAAD